MHRENARVSGRPVEKFASRLFLSLFAVLVLLIAWTFRDYGMTWDEDVQARYGQTLLRWYATLGGDDSAARFGNLYLYGGFFETLAEFASKFSPFGHFETRHLIGALFGLLAFLAVFGAGRELGGPLAGLFAATLLALDPLFYGHMFANSKDSPFAAAFMVALYLSLVSCRALVQNRNPPFAALGLAIGVCAGIRVWGLALLAALAVLWIGVGLVVARSATLPESNMLFRRAGRAFMGVTLIAWLAMIGSWPWAAKAPFTRPFQTLSATATLRPDVFFLFRGEIANSAELPRDYALTWLAITLPEVHLFGLLLGLVMAGMWLARKRFMETTEDAVKGLSVALLAFISLSPLVLVAVFRPFLYDGIRHLLFIVPPLCVLSAVGLAEFLRGSLPRSIRTIGGLLALASCVTVLADMVDLHPYQTVYFNRAIASGLPAAAERYETDYWGSTYKEGVEWLVRNYEPPTKRPIRLAHVGEVRQLTYYLAREEKGNRFVAHEMDTDPHVLLITRNRNRFRRVKGTLLHTINRKGIPLLFIFEIRRPQDEGGLEDSSR
jgi:hypothetical protein